MDNQNSINVFKGKNKNEYNIDNLKKEFAQYLQCENLNFLLGSGCSSYIDENGDEKAIPTMKGLFSNFFNQNPNAADCRQKAILPPKGENSPFRQ